MVKFALFLCLSLSLCVLKMRSLSRQSLHQPHSAPPPTPFGVSIPKRVDGCRVQVKLRGDEEYQRRVWKPQQNLWHAALLCARMHTCTHTHSHLHTHTHRLNKAAFWWVAMNAPSHTSNPKLADFANAAFKTRWYRYSENLYCLFSLSLGNPSVNQDFPHENDKQKLSVGIPSRTRPYIGTC